MINVSKAYKDIMNRPIRNRALISIGIGIVNQNAQETGQVSGESAYWSKGNIFNNNQTFIDYATLEDNQFATDGSMYFMPEDNEYMQLLNNGFTTNEPLGGIRIDFPEIYAIKGLTIDFGKSYPTKFTVQTSAETYVYENASEKFVTNDVMGDTDFIAITPNVMSGGMQRLRIKSILFGVGLVFSNNETKQVSISEYASSISEELPEETMSLSFYDTEKRFDIDAQNSFIDYLETKQKVGVSFGLELDNSDVEWHQIATLYLSDWNVKDGIVNISATDLLTQAEDIYTLGNRIYERTAYEEAESILSDAGLEPDEYYIDEYLNDIPLINPMPEGMHKECLQVLANACRCIIRQDENGKIMIRANFANVLSPTDFTVTSTGDAKWSKSENVIVGSEINYADMTNDFFTTDGSMYFMPEDESYLATGYVSNEISDENGNFVANPTISIELVTQYSYFGISIDFGANPPQELIVHLSNNGTATKSIKYDDLTKESVLLGEFLNFDKITFEFTKGYPMNRVVVNKISFSDLSDYVLYRKNMCSNPVGYKEKRIKTVRVKRFTFEADEEGKPVEKEDEVYTTRQIGEVGEIKTLTNPLVHTEEHAELLAEWVGNYYANNVTYDVGYRGEPRINATDIIYMENENEENQYIQAEITNHTLNFDGAFSGSLGLRRALRMIGG